LGSAAIVSIVSSAALNIVDHGLVLSAMAAGEHPALLSALIVASLDMLTPLAGGAPGEHGSCISSLAVLFLAYVKRRTSPSIFYELGGYLKDRNS
jgi:hypothetical protein